MFSYAPPRPDDQSATGVRVVISILVTCAWAVTAAHRRHTEHAEIAEHFILFILRALWFFLVFGETRATHREPQRIVGLVAGVLEHLTVRSRHHAVARPRPNERRRIVDGELILQPIGTVERKSLDDMEAGS